MGLTSIKKETGMDKLIFYIPFSVKDLFQM